MFMNTSVKINTLEALLELEKSFTVLIDKERFISNYIESSKITKTFNWTSVLNILEKVKLLNSYLSSDDLFKEDFAFSVEAYSKTVFDINNALSLKLNNMTSDIYEITSSYSYLIKPWLSQWKIINDFISLDSFISKALKAISLFEAEYFKK